MLDRNPHIFPGSPHVVILGAGASKAAFLNGDAEGRKIPLMNELVDCLELSSIFKEHNIECNNHNFEDVYSDLVTSNKKPALVQYLNQIIYDYFSEMKMPDTPTLYDYLLLSLREKDIIATFNWDPFLALAYQRNTIIKRLPQIVFLHGNVFVGICEKHKKKGFINCKCSVCGNCFSPVDILYPIKEKNYFKNPFIKEQWDIISNYLNNAYLFTVFGYSAPNTDVAAVNLLKSAWKSNRLIEQYEIEIVDIASKTILKQKWTPFVFEHHCSYTKSIENSELWLYPRRSCEAFAASHLMCNPWQINRLQIFNKLSDLHKWLKPLVDEEGDSEIFSGGPCPPIS